MDRERLGEIGRELLSGGLSLDDFQTRLLRLLEKEHGFSDIGETLVDLNREDRCGFPEVVYAEGKTPEAIRKIFETQREYQIECFATRLSPEKAEYLTPFFPNARYNPIARTFRVSSDDSERSSARNGDVAILSAGTSDRPVAEEALETVLWTGANAVLIQDVGVAGPHRLVARLDQLRKANAIVVVAGMEGALPSVVGGYVSVPVIAVPTSVGYGTSFGGITALLGMLNSCASNVAVVNIDAGFKAGYLAGLIARQVARSRRAL